MKHVLKWGVPIDDQVHEIGGGRVVHIGQQHSRHEVVIWTEEVVGREALDPRMRRVVKIVGTGQEYNDQGAVIGSVIDNSGEDILVWHIVSYL